MGKVLKGVALAAVFVGLAFATGGASVVAAGATAAAGSTVVAGIAFTGFGTALFSMAVASVLTGFTGQFFGPKIPKSQVSRLNVTLDPSTPRKAVFGTTAMNLDMRYHETSGTDQEYVDHIIAVAAHKVASIDQIWFDETKAWDSGTVQSTYNGYLTINVREEGTEDNYIDINGGTKWGSSRRLTGCAYVHIRIKRTGNSKKSESPLVSGLPSRVTIIGEGAPLYDPRLDSTVSGGSGAHRSDDQDTWGAYTDADDCDNPALQLLWWLLGWEINDKLSIGCGVPAARIDMESFITAANLCDESVTLATGGTQYRYRTSGTAGDSDGRMDIINNLLASMNGTLRDNNGKLTLTVLKNDLADWTLQFDDNDVLDAFKWDQTRGLSSSYNKVRGRYVDPSTNSLYQLVEYPEIGFNSPDGIERSMTLDLGYVEDGRRAQRIAKQVLQRNQYRGMFSATFTAKAMGCSVGDIILLSFSPLGWSNKPFRVVSQEIGFDGRVPLALVEENPAIYAWDAEDSAPVTPTAPTVYDPLNNPFILGVAESSTTANWSGIVDDDGNLPENNADVTATNSPSLDPIASVSFSANYLGTLDEGQLPKYIIATRRKGGTDVSSTTTWSILSQSGISDVTVTVSASGVITIPSGANIQSSSSIVVRSVKDGVTLDAAIGVSKFNSPAPATGTAGGTTVQDSTFTAFNSTSFVAISDLMTVSTGSSGAIQFGAPLTLYLTYSGTNRETNVQMKWQYRLVGGSFSDVAAAVSSDPDPVQSDLGEIGGFIIIPGSIDCSPNLTGLSASTNYEVQLFAKVDTAISPDTCNATGTASGVGS